MLDYIRAFQAYFSGKLENDKDLQKGFPIFIAFIGIVWFFTSYNSYMSFAYYQYQAGTMPGAEIVAGLVTAIIAISIVFLGVYVIDYVQDWLANRDMQNRTLATFAAAFIAWIILQGWDIYVNRKGIDPASIATTVAAKEDRSEEVLTQYDSKLVGMKQELFGLYHNYYWCSTHKTRHNTHNPKITGNQYLQTLEIPEGVCKKEGFWFGCGGGTGRGCEGHNSIKSKIASFEKRIEAQLDLQTQAVKIAQDEYLTDQNRYANDIGNKSETHGYMIWISYITIFLCSVFNGNYVNRLMDYVKKIYGKKGVVMNVVTQPPKSQAVASAGVSEITKKVVVNPLDNREESISITRAVSLSDIEVLLDKKLDKDPITPNNTGKKYKTKTPVKGKQRLTKEDIIAMLSQYKESFPDGAQKDATEHFKGKIGKTSIYTYWDHA